MLVFRLYHERDRMSIGTRSRVSVMLLRSDKLLLSAGNDTRARQLLRGPPYSDNALYGGDIREDREYGQYPDTGAE